jgi:hypothetical protein
MKVDVYRNLHATDDFERWSVLSRDSDYEYGRVIDHGKTVSLRNVEMVIHQSGLEKYRETGVKNVHAFLRGELLGLNIRREFDGRDIYYDGDGAFRYVDSDDTVGSAKFAFLEKRASIIG